MAKISLRCLALSAVLFLIAAAGAGWALIGSIVLFVIGVVALAFSLLGWPK